MSQPLTKSRSLLVVMLLLIPHSVIAREVRPRNPLATADLIFAGDVKVNREPAIPGLTLFTGNVTSTGTESQAVINMGTSGMIQIYEDTEVVWEAEDCGFLLRLSGGRVRVYSPSGVIGRVITPNGEVMTKGDAPSAFYVESDKQDIKIEPEVGQVDLVTEGARTTLSSDAADPSIYQKPSDTGKDKKRKRGIWGTIMATVTTVAIIVATGGASAVAAGGTGPIVISPSPSR